MSDDTDRILRLLDRKSSVRVLVGTFVSYTAAQYVVDVGGGRIPALPLTSYLPEVNETVWVMFVDDVAYVTGSSTVRPGKGTVLSVGSGLVTLTTPVGNVTVPYDSRLSPTAGQKFKLYWHGGGFALAPMSTDPSDPTPPPPPGQSGSTHVDTFTAQDAGSYQSGRWWTPEVWASDNNLGAWFYGTKIRDTTPAGAQIQKVELFASFYYIFGSAPNFGLHGYQGKPGSSPTFDGVTAVGVRDHTWITLPVGWGNSLKAGGGYFGVGLSHGGFSKGRSLAQDALSGALRITSTY